MKLLLTVLIVFLSHFCLHAGNSLLGLWEYEYRNDSLSIFRRVTKFSNEPGFELKESGIAFCRYQNSWCGAGGLTYESYDGIWEFNTDTLTIRFRYYSSFREEKWSIRKQTDTMLTMRWIYSGMNNYLIGYRMVAPITDTSGITFYNKGNWLILDDIQGYEFYELVMRFARYPNNKRSDFVSAVLSGKNNPLGIQMRKITVDWENDKYWVIKKKIKTQNRTETRVIVIDPLDWRKMKIGYKSVKSEN